MVQWFKDRKISGYAVMLILVSTSFALAAYTMVETRASDRAIVQCIRDYNQEQSEAQRPRIEANNEKNKALDEVIDAAGVLFSGHATERDRIQAQVKLIKYQELSAELAEVVAANPYPAGPDRLCKGR